MPAVKSIQTGSKTIVIADGLTPTQTINPITVANAIVMFTYRSGDAANRQKRHSFRARLTSTTQITFTRFESSDATDVVIEWTVVEYAASALQSLQVGSLDCVGTPANATISAVDTARTFPIVQCSTAQFDATNFARMSITSTTNLRFTFSIAPASTDFFADYQVVEFKTTDASVQSGSMSFFNATPGTATITAVNSAKTLVAASANGGNGAGIRYFCRVDLESTVQVKAQMENFGTSLSGDASFFVVEMLDGSTVEHGRTQIPNAATVPTSQPTWATAMTNGAVFNANPCSPSYVSSASDGTPYDGQFTVVLGSPQSGVTLTRNGTTTDLETAWQVVQWASVFSITLVDSSGQVRQNLTGLKWAWFDQATPDALLTPTSKGILETTDASGLLVIYLVGTLLTAGQTGWLIVTDSDGTANQGPSHKAFSGPITLA